MAAAAFCLLSALSSAEARKPHCLLRVHLEANARDGDVFSSQLASPVTGRKVVIEKSATISERDVVAFTPYPGTNGSYGALFQLDDHGRLALDSLSVERRGTYLYVFVNGRAVAELQIDRRVSDGKLYVASGLTQNDLALMKKDWPASGQRKK
jgi:hypothetical protein